MARLGDLERAVMDVLWNNEVWVTAREVGRQLHHDKRLAYTTVLTVLDRLERKGFVLRERAGRAHRYRAADSRETVVAVAMLEALDNADDRDSALVRFVGGVSPEEAAVLRRALATADAGPADAGPADLRPGDPVDAGPGTETDPTAGPSGRDAETA